MTHNLMGVTPIDPCIIPREINQNVKDSEKKFLDPLTRSAPKVNGVNFGPRPVLHPSSVETVL